MSDDASPADTAVPCRFAAHRAPGRAWIAILPLDPAAFGPGDVTLELRPDIDPEAAAELADQLNACAHALRVVNRRRDRAAKPPARPE